MGKHLFNNHLSWYYIVLELQYIANSIKARGQYCLKATGVELSGLYVDCVDKFTFFPLQSNTFRSNISLNWSVIQITLYFKIWANFELLYIENTLFVKSIALWMEIFLSSLIISHNIWEFSVVWLVDTGVTWLKMTLWDILGLVRLCRSDGFLMKLKISLSGCCKDSLSCQVLKKTIKPH